MSLKPLGLENPLIPPTSLGQNFQSLQPPSPLGQNFQPLQSPPPLGQSPTSLEQIEPLEFASYFDEEIETGDRGFGTWDGGGENPQVLTNNPVNSQSSTPLAESASNGDNVASSKSNFSELPNDNPPQTTVRRKEDEGSSSVLNAPSLDIPTENIARFKPLGLSKPLAQESDFLISPSVSESLEKPNCIDSPVRDRRGAGRPRRSASSRSAIR